MTNEDKFGLLNIYEDNPEGMRAAELIMKYLLEKDPKMNVGTTGIFKNGDELGYVGGESSNAILSVIHEEGDHRRYFSMDACYEVSCMAAEMGVSGVDCYEPYESMIEMLRTNGFMCETYSGWLSHVYVEEY